MKLLEPMLIYPQRLTPLMDMNGGKQMRDIWNMPAIAPWEKSCGKHPTQKPLPLLARIIKASTKEDEWILDPFSGAGTTGIAANLLGRKYLGIDITKEYLDMSIKRREEIDNKETKEFYLQKLIDR